MIKMISNTTKTVVAGIIISLAVTSNASSIKHSKEVIAVPPKLSLTQDMNLTAEQRKEIKRIELTMDLFIKRTKEQIKAVLTPKQKKILESRVSQSQVWQEY